MAKNGESSLTEVIEIHGCDSMEYIFENEDIKLPANWEFEGNPSLCLVKIKDASVWVKTFEEKKISLNFTYNNVQYRYIEHISNRFNRLL